MTRPALVERQKGILDTGDIHIAFQLGSREQVNALTERLRNDGYRGSADREPSATAITKAALPE